MPSGGARRSGKIPDPNALRRDRKSDPGFTTLPTEGRPGMAPDWPLTDETPRELHLWELFWRKPQAVLWERNEQVFEVALHVRCFAEAEAPGAPTALRTLVRQQADALLLTMPAMQAARVRIAADEIAAARTQQQVSPPAPAAPSARDRLKAISGGAG